MQLIPGKKKHQYFSKNSTYKKRLSIRYGRRFCVIIVGVIGSILFSFKFFMQMAHTWQSYVNIWVIV